MWLFMANKNLTFCFITHYPFSEELNEKNIAQIYVTTQRDYFETEELSPCVDDLGQAVFEQLKISQKFLNPYLTSCDY